MAGTLQNRKSMLGFKEQYSTVYEIQYLISIMKDLMSIESEGIINETQVRYSTMIIKGH